MNFKDKIKRVAISASAFVDRAKPVINEAYQVVTAVTGEATPFQKTMGIVSFASSMNNKILGNMLHSNRNTKEVYYLNSGGLTMSVAKFFERKKVIGKVVQAATFRIEHYSSQDYLMGNFYGVDLVFSAPTSGTTSGDRCKVIIPNTLSEEMANSLISRKLWELLEHALYYENSTFSNYKDSVCDNYVITDEAISLESDIVRAKTAGIKRSILLCGPPGSGKTEVVNYVSTRLFKRRLYINHDSSPEFIQNLVINLSPDCVVINDFTVVASFKELLPLLEVLKRHVPFVLLTANTVEEIPGALIRPGRVDEVIKIDKMHGPAMLQLVKMILGTSYTDAIFNQVKEWPMAFIQELKAREILGRDIHKEIDDLKTRLSQNDKNNDTVAYRAFADTAPRALSTREGLEL